MNNNSMYFCSQEIFQLIRNLGGEWNDNKERPVVCMLKLDESDIYWAIPVGNWDHRDKAAKARIRRYMQRDSRDISSCFYHVGNTTVKSIFFISDVIPITEEYIEREYKGYDDKIYTIKNPKLIETLTKKLKRILYFEENKPNYFRQHITDIKEYLIRKEKEIANYKKIDSDEQEKVPCAPEMEPDMVDDLPPTQSQ